MIRAFALALVLSGAAFAANAATADEIRPLKLATGEVLVHAFRDGMPLPSESRWMLCSAAGPSFVPEGGRYRLDWVVQLKDKGGLAKAREVSGCACRKCLGQSRCRYMTDLQRRSTAASWSARGAALRPVRITPGSTHRRPRFWCCVSRSTPPDGEQDKLVQPVLIGTEGKRNLRAHGIGG